MSTPFDDADTLHSAILKIGKRADIIEPLQRLLEWDNDRLRLAAEELSSQHRIDYVVVILNRLRGGVAVIENVDLVSRAQSVR